MRGKTWIWWWTEVSNLREALRQAIPGEVPDPVGSPSWSTSARIPYEKKLHQRAGARIAEAIDRGAVGLAPSRFPVEEPEMVYSLFCRADWVMHWMFPLTMPVPGTQRLQAMLAPNPRTDETQLLGFLLVRVWNLTGEAEYLTRAECFVRAQRGTPNGSQNTTFWFSS